MKKILLINPARNYIPGHERKVCSQPLGISYIAAVLRINGHDVIIIDSVAEGYENESTATNGFVRYGLSKEEIKSRIEGFSPDIVGVGCVQSLQLYEAYEVFEIAKMVNPRIITVFGGGHASANHRNEISKKEIDYLVVGEGEISIVNLINKLEKGHLSGERMPGVAYKVNGELIYSHGERPMNLDQLPFPAYDLLPMDKYNRPQASPSSYGKGKIAIIQTSRGCPHNCTHCPVHVVFGKPYRCRSIDNVIKEIKLLIKNYKIDEICIEDSNFTINRKRVFEFCNQIMINKINIRFSLPHGIEVATLDNELLSKMWDAGFYALHLSIESVNDSVLKCQDKELVPLKILQLVDDAKEIGYKITGYFMIGFPDETLFDIKRTVAFAKRLNLNKVNFFIYTPLPGTVIYDECVQKKLFIDNFDITHLRYAKANLNTYNLTHAQIQDLRYNSWREIVKSKENTNKNYLNFSMKSHMHLDLLK